MCLYWCHGLLLHDSHLAHDDWSSVHHRCCRSRLALRKSFNKRFSLRTLANLVQCAVGGGLLLGQILAGLGVRYLPRMKIQMLVASVILVAFVAALATSTERTRGRTIAFLLISTMSAGYVENLTLSSIALVWDPEDIGLVAGTMGAIRTALSAVATSMYSSILATELAKYLPRYVTPAATEAGLPAGSLPSLFTGITAGDYSKVQGMTSSIATAVGDAVRHSYIMSFRTMFLCTLPFGAILLVSAFYVPNIEEYLTDEVARKLHGTGISTKPVAKEAEEEPEA